MEPGEIQYTKRDRGKQALAGTAFGGGAAVLGGEILGIDFGSFGPTMWIVASVVFGLIIGALVFVMAG